VPDEEYLAVMRKRIRDMRISKELRQEDVAERAGLSLQSYQRFEARSARRFNPTILKLRVIAKAIGLDISFLTAEPSRTEIQSLRQEKGKGRRVYKGH
jgi:transcriptional regulator with XRE-family HTH domain